MEVVFDKQLGAIEPLKLDLSNVKYSLPQSVLDEINRTVIPSFESWKQTKEGKDAIDKVMQTRGITTTAATTAPPSTGTTTTATPKAVTTTTATPKAVTTTTATTAKPSTSTAVTNAIAKTESGVPPEPTSFWQRKTIKGFPVKNWHTAAAAAGLTVAVLGITYATSTEKGGKRGRKNRR